MNWKFRCFVLITLMMLYFAVDEWVKYLGAKDRLGKNISLFYNYGNCFSLFSMASMVG